MCQIFVIALCIPNRSVGKEYRWENFSQGKLYRAYSLAAYIALVKSLYAGIIVRLKGLSCIAGSFRFKMDSRFRGNDIFGLWFQKKPYGKQSRLFYLNNAP